MPASKRSAPLTETDGNVPANDPPTHQNKKARTSTSNDDNVEDSVVATSPKSTEEVPADGGRTKAGKQKEKRKEPEDPDHVYVFLGFKKIENDKSNEDDEEGDDDEDEDEDEDENDLGNREIIEALVSKAGVELANEWGDEAEKRCPDSHNMYIYNDFEGYGLCEVMENQLMRIGKELTKKNKDIKQLWTELQGAAMFLEQADLTIFHIKRILIDDPDWADDIIIVFGAALVLSLHAITPENKDKLPPSPGLFVLMLIKFFADFEELQASQPWVRVIIELAREKDVSLPVDLVQLEGNLTMQEHIDSALNEEEDGEPSDSGYRDPISASVKNWKIPNWTSLWKLFTERNARGDQDFKKPGKRYDITKFTKAEKKKYSFGA